MSEELWNRIKEEYEKAKVDPTYDITFEMDGKYVEVGRASFTKGVIIMVRESE